MKYAKSVSLYSPTELCDVCYVVTVLHKRQSRGLAEMQHRRACLLSSHWGGVKNFNPLWFLHPGISNSVRVGSVETQFPKCSLTYGFCGQKSLGNITYYSLLLEIHNSHCSIKNYQKNAINKPTSTVFHQ